MLIDFSKRDGKIMYAKNTPIVVNKLLTIVFMNLFGLIAGGIEGVKLCWQPQCMLVFGLIGSVYAMGDFLEMLSLSKLSGGVYQVLLQTKLLITALMAWRLKGTRQSSMQWHVLFALFLAMSAFVIVDQEGSGGGAAGSLPTMAVMCVLLKVGVSCYCAVLSEKYLKAFKDMPLYAKISGLATTWAAASFLFSRMETSVVENGFFHGWDGVTWLVTCSFVIKTVSTMYLLQMLDSLQKNIGEAMAVIVIFLGQIVFSEVGKSFDLAAFLLCVLVVGLVKTYLVSPKAGAKKSAMTSKNVSIVSLKAEGSPHMRDLGFDPVACDVADALPAGVFYGVLGGVHAVCGTTDPGNPQRCELLMLSEHMVDSAGVAAGGSNGVSRRAAGATPLLPRGPSSLAVLGQIRGPLPLEAASLDRCNQDVEEARASLQRLYGGGLSAAEP